MSGVATVPDYNFTGQFVTNAWPISGTGFTYAVQAQASAIIVPVGSLSETALQFAVNLSNAVNATIADGTATGSILAAAAVPDEGEDAGDESEVTEYKIIRKVGLFGCGGTGLLPLMLTLLGLGAVKWQTHRVSRRG